MTYLPSGEQIAETKTCATSGKEFVVTDKDVAFYDRISPEFGGKKYQLPTPTLCPQERDRRRLAWRNEYRMYPAKCAGTGVPILTVFSGESGIKSYETEYWWSDSWDAMEFGRSFDFDRNFFEQFGELMRDVPQISRSTMANQNCDYVNQAGWNKDCYLTFECAYNEKCYFSNYIVRSKNCFDCLVVDGCELCYGCIDCENCFELMFSQDCENCSDSAFLRDCIGCKNCFGCSNLRNKQYFFLNQELSREQYEQKVGSIKLHSIEQLQKTRHYFDEQHQSAMYKHLQGNRNENVTGCYLNECKDCHFSYDLKQCRDCRYSTYLFHSNFVYDTNVFGGEEGTNLALECHEIGVGADRILFSDQVWENVSNVHYSKMCCKSVNDIFGCVGLKKKSYCIFNTSYSQHEYEDLAGRIVDHMRSTGEWGEFFPYEISPFAYNETIAQEYYPLSKEEVQERGWRWSELPLSQGDSGYAPLSIDQYDERVVGAEVAKKNIDTCLASTCVCSVTSRPFKIVRMELAFYIEHGLPMPDRHPEVRHLDRLKKRNPKQVHPRACHVCREEMQAAYLPDDPRKVCCEDCYRRQVY